jgi:hypothetical protein
MEVYSNTYTNKNIEITNKMNQLKTKRKFVEWLSNYIILIIK